MTFVAQGRNHPSYPPGLSFKFLAEEVDRDHKKTQTDAIILLQSDARSFRRRDVQRLKVRRAGTPSSA